MYINIYIGLDDRNTIVNNRNVIHTSMSHYIVIGILRYFYHLLMELNHSVNKRSFGII
jgi:hypothetical protein